MFAVIFSIHTKQKKSIKIAHSVGVFIPVHGEILLHPAGQQVSFPLVVGLWSLPDVCI